MKANLVTAICDMLVYVVENHNSEQGICWRLGDYFHGVGSSLHDGQTLNIAYALIREKMYNIARSKWSDIDYTFPIQHPEKHAEQAYHDAYAERRLWDNTTEYGRNRWAMLAHLCEWASNLPVD